MGKEEGQEIGEQDFGQVVKDVPEVVEPTPPTAEEQLATLQEKHDALEAKYEKADKEARGSQAALTRKDRESKAQTDLVSSITSRMDKQDGHIKILAGLVSKGASGEITPEDAKAYEAEFTKLEERQAKFESDTANKAKQDEQFRTYDDLWTRAQKFGTYKDNDEVAEIYDALVDGKSYKAERLLGKLEVTPVETKKDSAEELQKKWIAEGKRQALEESGGLNAETGQPSGVLKNEESIREAYRKNPYDEKAYRDMRELGKG